jgi:Arc/MetJ family transcription regulator
VSGGRVALRRKDPDHRREIPDQEDHLRPRSCIWRILFSTTVWPMDVRCRRVEAQLDAQRLTQRALQLGGTPIDQEFVGATLKTATGVRCQWALQYRYARLTSCGPTAS